MKARLISRSGSSPTVVAKDPASLLESPKKSSPKPPARNSSLNSLFFWKNTNNGKKVSPNPSKSGDVKKDEVKQEDEDVVLTKTPLPEQLVSDTSEVKAEQIRD